MDMKSKSKITAATCFFESGMRGPRVRCSIIIDSFETRLYRQCLTPNLFKSTWQLFLVKACYVNLRESQLEHNTILKILSGPLNFDLRGSPRMKYQTP